MTACVPFDFAFFGQKWVQVDKIVVVAVFDNGLDASLSYGESERTPFIVARNQCQLGEELERTAELNHGTI